MSKSLSGQNCAEREVGQVGIARECDPKDIVQCRSEVRSPQSYHLESLWTLVRKRMAGTSAQILCL
jgi:hypothetical protein